MRSRSVVNIDEVQPLIDTSGWMRCLLPIGCKNNTQICTAWSETVAFNHLRLNVSHLICGERDLCRRYASCMIPEGVFFIDGKNVSIEVKRITCIRPRTPSQRWQWRTTVENAVMKGNSVIIADYNVQLHIAVFVLPECLSMRKRQRAVRHIGASLERIKNIRVPVRSHIIVTEVDAFNSSDVV